MPRTVAPILRKMYERSNPAVLTAVEIHRPDVSKIFRRVDQFLGVAKVSEVPAGTLAADQTGGLSLAKTAGLQIASFAVETNSFDVQRPAADRRYRGVIWTPDPAFPASIAKKVSVRIHRNTTKSLTLALQVYKISRVIRGTVNPGVRVASPTGTQGRIVTTFIPLLANPVQRRTSSIPATAWVGDNATIEFDLTGLQLNLRRSGVDGLGANGLELSGEDVRYFFVVECVDGFADDNFEWIYDGVTARTVASVGTFQDSEWNYGVPGTQSAWSQTLRNQCPTFKLTVETYPVTSQAVYAIDVGADPSAESEGRIEFERAEPKGTSATLELSTAGAGGPWTAVTHGDTVAVKQQTYHLRVTLNADAAQRQTPRVLGLGVEFLETVDATREAIVEPVQQAINVPFCQATIGQGSIAIVRTGRRDYRDIGSDLAVGGAASALEAEIHLASDHPAIARKDWLTLCRAPVSDRIPTGTSERFTLLSLLKQLQAEIPAREETVSRIYTVLASTTTQITVDAADVPESDWDGQGFYLRIRKTAAVGLEAGYVQTIDGATAPNKLVFSAATPLPVALVAGDEIEVHSARYTQPTLRWDDADLADIWWELLTVHRAIPEERIGRAELGRSGRSGLPPRITERAPGDPVTQAKLKVTVALQKPESADKLIDQISFLLGGATVEVGGQIVFRQIYPIRDITGAIVVPVEPIAAVFDESNTIGLETPTGLEQRITSLACDYGVDTTTVAEQTAPAKMTEYVDVDALAWLNQQDLHELGHSSIPAEIARWCYSKADGGLLLASLACQQVVLVASTGLRVWSWQSTEHRPELVVGDRVIVVTDQYTDFDPTREIEVRGRWAYPLVLTEVLPGGRRFRGMLMGLSAAALKVRGGAGDVDLGNETAADDESSLNDMKEIDSVDGLTRTITFVAGARVHRVAVLKRSMILPVTTDPWPPADAGDFASWLADGGSVEFLIPNPVTRLVSYSVGRPDIAHQTFLQFEPRFVDLSAGPIVRLRLDAKTGISIPQGTVSVDANGGWSWSVDGHFLVDHYRYAESFSSFPNDAAAAAGTLISGRQVTRSGGSPLSFGQTVYVTLIPYDAQGNAMPSVRLRGSYQSYTPTKTTSYPASQWMVQYSLGNVQSFNFDSDGFVNAKALALIGDSLESTQLIAFPPIPDGVTLTEFALDIYHNAGGDDASSPPLFFLKRHQAGAATSLGFAFGTIDIGWQTLTIAVSEVTADRAYVALLSLTGESDVGEQKVGQMYITYQMGNPSTTI